MSQVKQKVYKKNKQTRTSENANELLNIQKNCSVFDANSKQKRKTQIVQRRNKKQKQHRRQLTEKQRPHQVNNRNSV